MSDKPRIIGPILDYVEDKCPICNGNISTRCRCLKGDSSCVNGHQFHRCLKHEVFVEGDSDHCRPTMECSCGRDKIDKIVDKHLGDAYSDLSQYSIKALQEEIDRRTIPQALGEFVRPIVGTQSERIRAATDGYLTRVAEGTAREDEDHAIYEVLMTEVYGEYVWEWLNERLP